MTGIPLRLVGVSGSTSAISKSTALVGAVLEEVELAEETRTTFVTLADLVPELGAVLDPADAPERVAAALEAIEQADLLVVGTPVRHGAYAGLFKHLFDLVGRRALDEVPVILTATGSTARHSLVIDHQLRPLFSALHAAVLPTGVFAHDGDFQHGRLASQECIARVSRVAASGLAAARTRAHLAAAGTYVV